MKNRRKADHWFGLEEKKVRCSLCPHHCKIADGKWGLCGIRHNVDGVLHAEAFGYYPAVHIDPIEKKPLNHFLPGSNILSVGSVGCNLSCKHCQNWSLARMKMTGEESDRISVSEMVDHAGRRGSIGVAFTYNEPTINQEYIMETARELEKKGMKTVLVTNGYLEREPWDELMDVTDGANIDVKSFSDDFYRSVAGGSLKPVLDNVESAHDKGVHVEIAYLVIPGYNDDDEQIDAFSDWVIGSLSADVPVHFNRFHPDHQMADVPATSPESLLDIRQRSGEKGLSHVYIGNLGGSGLNDTLCPQCGEKVIDRSGFLGVKVRLKKGECPSCGARINGVWS